MQPTDKPDSSVLPNATGPIVPKASNNLNNATLNRLKEWDVEVIARLSKPGACGDVYKAKNNWNHELVVKVVKRPNERDQLKRHRRECQILAAGKIPRGLAPEFRHAQVVNLPKSGDESHQIDEDDSHWRAQDEAERPMLVMTLVRGCEVDDYANAANQASLDDRIDLCIQMFEGLSRLHKVRIVHGDLSSRNVMVDEGNSVCFVDYGCAVDLGRVSATITSEITRSGTPGYAPRAQLDGKAPPCIWTDVRALSAVAYDLLAKERHDENYSIEEKKSRLTKAKVPKEVAAIILKGLREKRLHLKIDSELFPDAGSVADALRAWRRKEKMRRPSLAFGMTSAALLMLAAIGWWQWSVESAAGQRQTVTVLRRQAESLASRSQRAIGEQLDEFDRALAEFDSKSSDLGPLQRRQRLGELTGKLQDLLARGQRLDRSLPRYTIVGQILAKIPWESEAKRLGEVRAQLQARLTKLGEALDRGEVDQQDERLETFAKDVLDAWEANEAARSCVAARVEFDNLWKSVPDRLRTEQRAEYDQRAASAAQVQLQWHEADSRAGFELTKKALGEARDSLAKWLDERENTSEKIARAMNNAQHVAALEKQLKDGETRFASAQSDIEKLRRQYTDLSELNQQDRLSLQRKTSELTETTRRLSETTEKLKTEQDRATKLQKQTEADQTQLAEVTKQKSLAEKQRDELDGKLKTAQTDLDKSRQDLDTAHIESRTWKQKAETAQAQLASRPTNEAKAPSEPKPVAPQSGDSIAARTEVSLFLPITGTVLATALVAFVLRWLEQLAAQQVAVVGGRESPLTRNGREASSRGKNVAEIMAEVRNRPTSLSTAQPPELTSIADGTQAGQLLTLTVKGIPVRFRWCPAGTFQMGSPAGENGGRDDEHQRSVTLTKGFWLMETECTQRLWVAVMGSALNWSKGYGKGDDYPVYNVSHDEAVEFSKRMQSLLGGAVKVSLPTEAQWEYACRAGTTTRYSFDDESKLGEYAWYESNSGRTTHPVAQKKPNAWGLHDMHGNVWEWCSDWHSASPSGERDPSGPWQGSDRVGRGGGWYGSAWYCRSANRSRGAPGNRSDDLGFRLSLVPSCGG